MKKFIVLYKAPKSAMEQMSKTSPEDMKKGMEPWMAWAKKCGSALIDMGTPLGNAQKVTKTGGGSLSGSEIIGYSILEAKDMDTAEELLTGHPHLGWADGCEIEVYESLPLPM